MQAQPRPLALSKSAHTHSQDLYKTTGSPWTEYAHYYFTKLEEGASGEWHFVHMEVRPHQHSWA